MEQPKRKNLRLPDFDYGEIGCYFVTLCTHNRARIFSLESPNTIPNKIIRKWIQETQNKFPGVVFDHYVIMPDHLHFLITIHQKSATTLPDVLCYFKTMTTNTYIRGVKSGYLPAFDKKLWQKTYFEHVIRNQEDYNNTWEYIQFNPARWKEKHPNE